MFPPASSIISIDLRILQRSASRIAPPKSGRASVAGWLLLAEEDARVFEWMVLTAFMDIYGMSQEDSANGLAKELRSS